MFPGDPAPGFFPPVAGMPNRPWVGPPSPWVMRFLPLIPRQRPVLDVACGAGRHCRALLDRGHRVVAVDRDLRGLADLHGRPALLRVRGDFETATPWPFAPSAFDGIVVTHYLHRPLIAALIEALAPGGVLIYETFAVGNQRYGRLAHPDHLLRSGELLDRVSGRLQVVAYEHGVVSSPKAAVVQRLCAVHDLTPAADLDGDPEPSPLPPS